MVVGAFGNHLVLQVIMLAGADRWNEVDFAVFAYRGKQNVLIDFTVDRDSETLRFN
jgi:hypothetical protein